MVALPAGPGSQLTLYRSGPSVQNGTGQIIASQTDVGGWPTLAENTRELTLPAAPNGDDDEDGYTNLEEWLHEQAAAVESP